MKFTLFFLALLSFGCARVVPTSETLDLSSLTFKEAGSRTSTSLRKGNGYVIAYVNLGKDCSSCLRSMIEVKPAVDTYDDITFILVNKGDQGLEDIYEKVGVLDCLILVDNNFSLGSYFHLKEEPLLLVIDRDLKLATALRVIDLNAFSKLREHCHEILQSL